MVEAADLEQVLAECAGLDVVVVGFGYSAEEVHGVGVAQIIVQSGKNKALSTEDLLLGEAIIGNMAEVLDVGGKDLLVFGGNEHGGDTNQLKAVELANLAAKE